MIPYRRKKVQDKTSKATILTIPARVTVVKQGHFPKEQRVVHLSFEQGSCVRRLEMGAFVPCIYLRSICIPASVEFIGNQCFAYLDLQPRGVYWSPDSALETVTFEAGSKLREIERLAFYGCEHLQHLCIPASCEKMTARSFPDSRRLRLEIESGSLYFAKRENFVVDFAGHDLVRYCAGGTQELTIGDGIVRIGEYCFAECKAIRTVNLGPLSQLAAIDASGFAFCERLKAILIPASVRFLGKACFRHCSHLETVSFCTGSTLECIPEAAFVLCHFLTSIMFPSTVKYLGLDSLRICSRLVSSPWPLDSQLVRIEGGTFWDCDSLQSLFLPASVEFVGANCFLRCDALTSFTIASPSHLRELLDVPPALLGLIPLPDSVEILCLRSPSLWLPWGRALIFGAESRLVEIRSKQEQGWPLCRAFLHVSTGKLKRSRMELEFEHEVHMSLS